MKFQEAIDFFADFNQLRCDLPGDFDERFVPLCLGHARARQRVLKRIADKAFGKSA